MPPKKEEEDIIQETKSEFRNAKVVEVMPRRSARGITQVFFISMGCLRFCDVFQVRVEFLDEPTRKFL
jgi:hypothetical protein